MYKRVLLAADGAKESLVALREGALIAAAYKAAVHLVVVEREDPGFMVAEGVFATTRAGGLDALLEAGLMRLERLGVEATGEVLAGDPAMVIGAAARRFHADLVVVGHRQQTLLQRWWSGASGAYLVDQVPCSVLVARNLITDEEFEAKLKPG